VSGYAVPAIRGRRAAHGRPVGRDLDRGRGARSTASTSTSSRCCPASGFSRSTSSSRSGG